MSRSPAGRYIYAMPRATPRPNRMHLTRASGEWMAVRPKCIRLHHAEAEDAGLWCFARNLAARHRREVTHASNR